MRAIDSFNNLLTVNWDQFDWFHPVCNKNQVIKQWTNITQDKAVDSVYEKLCCSRNSIGIDFEKIDSNLVKQSIKLAFVIKNGKNKTKNECPTFEEFLISCLSYITPKTDDERIVYFQIGNILYKYRQSVTC